jgi:hypothetical protein
MEIRQAKRGMGRDTPPYRRRAPNLNGPDRREILIRIDGRKLIDVEAKFLAHADGFESLSDMLGFWAKGDQLPFRGHIIFWE